MHQFVVNGKFLSDNLSTVEKIPDIFPEDSANFLPKVSVNLTARNSLLLK